MGDFLQAFILKSQRKIEQEHKVVLRGMKHKGKARKIIEKHALRNDSRRKSF